MPAISVNKRGKMAYPNFKNKHLEEAIILPDHTGEARKKVKDKIPKRCIITYQDEAFNFLLKKYKNKSKKLEVGGTLWGCKPFYTKDFVFVYMLGVGAPHATIVFEELIALGITEFLNIGISGGLQKPGFFLCEKAIRDEGTSQHYLPHSKYSYPDKQLTEKLEKSFKKLKVKYTKGINWTIDAPFMETKAEVKKYKKQGVNTVEMEVSSLFVVAKLRKVKIAAAFFTSDILADEWEHLYKEKPEFVGNGLEKLTEIAINCFTE